MKTMVRSRKYYWNLLRFTGVTVLTAAVGMYFGVPLWQADAAMHPVRIPVGDVSPADLGLAYRDVAFSAADGVVLRGWYIPSRNRAAVILVHAFNGNRTGMIYHAELLARHGYGALLYDTRAQGESGGDAYALGWEDHLDILAAVDWLKDVPEVDPDRIGALGLSAGAKAVLYTATQTDDLRAVVLEGTRWRTFEDMRMAAQPDWLFWLPTEWLSFEYVKLSSGIRNPVPLMDAVRAKPPADILIITAGAEEGTSRAYFGAAREPKFLWVREESGHQIDALFDEPEEYSKRVLEWFNAGLLASPAPAESGG
jgi:hypothetical protein